jgi:hypothetical protein
MLKREIKFTNFDDQPDSEIHHFNLTKTEITNLELSKGDGLANFVQRVVEAKDFQTLVKEFQELILLAYGVRDGKKFVKSDELREAFAQTAAYDALFMELATDETAAAEFFIGVIPKDLREAVSKEEGLPLAPPAPPATA